jgi:hypothetical protein
VNQKITIRTKNPLIAGWLDIAAGIIGLLFVAFLTILAIGFAVGFGNPIELSQARIWLMLFVLAVPGILAIVGGVFSLRRRAWILSLIGSICAVPLGLGIIAVVLQVLSRNEFNRPE